MRDVGLRYSHFVTISVTSEPTGGNTQPRIGIAPTKKRRLVLKYLDVLSKY